MRISDWSSDVCSSDLQLTLEILVIHLMLDIGGRQPVHHIGNAAGNMRLHPGQIVLKARARPETAMQRGERVQTPANLFQRHRLGDVRKASVRSEERRVGKEWVSTCRFRGSPVR